MKRVKVFRYLCLLLVGLLAVSLALPVSAARPPVEPGEERINLDVTYPALEVVPGDSTVWSVVLSYVTYLGEGDAQLFEVSATAPKNWDVYFTDKYTKDVKISAITIDPGSMTQSEIRVVVTPPFWYMPEPGEYLITLDITGTTQEGEELTGSVDLTAVIPNTYVLDLIPTEGRYNASATSGKDNLFSIEVENSGSAPVDDIVFSADAPEEWEIEFSPDTVDSIGADSGQTIEVNIKPDARAIAGDYYISLRAEGTQTSAERVDIRVTVKTPTVWGWVGVIIILVVIAGIVYTFMRFSRR